MVTLVGAGPGDGGLMTIKGAKKLQEADVVLYDRFVSAEILAMIPGTAEKIDVGKSAGTHPVPQDEINQILLEKATQGLNVVRLKGGDPFVFGRGGEELELLAENGIAFEVVPGVTTAVAGAAYAGIPATHRNYSSSLHIMTGHGKNNKNLNINYDALVRAGGTLVFMMSVSAIGDVCGGCIAAGMDKDMPAAIVENATMGNQRKFIGTVETLPSMARENTVQSPAVIVIGKVSQLSERYDWFSKKPLFGKRAIVARVKPGTSKLSEKLRELGCHVTESPPAKIVPLTAPGSSIAKAIESIKGYSWLVFTSAIGANAFFDYIIEVGMDIRALHHLKIACVGKETEKEVNKRGVIVDYRPAQFNGAMLAQGLAELVVSGQRVLIARAKDGAEDLTRILEGAGVDFDDVAIYEKTLETKPIDVNGADFVAFTSSSTVEWFAKSAQGADLTQIKAVCIGEKTAATAKSHGMEVHISTDATIDSIVDKIKQLYNK